MSRFQLKYKNNKNPLVKKTNSNKFCKNNKQNHEEKQLQNTGKTSTTINCCANCSTTMLHKESKTQRKVKLNETDVNDQTIKEKPIEITSNNTDLDLSSLKLPQLDFVNKKFDADHETTKLCKPQISDLCLEDMQRIVHLIEEVARYKKEKEDDINEINLLKIQLKATQEKMLTLLASDKAKLKSINKMEIKHSEEESMLKAKLSELSLLLIEMHKQKELTNEQVKAIKVQAEKLTETLQKTHNEKLVIEKLYMNTKEELKLVREHVRGKLTKDVAVKKKVERKMEDKDCQWPEKEKIISDKDSGKIMEEETKDEEIKTTLEVKRTERTDDGEILSELFFTKTSVYQQDEFFLLEQSHIVNKFNFDDVFID